MSRIAHKLLEIAYESAINLKNLINNYLYYEYPSKNIEILFSALEKINSDIFLFLNERKKLLDKYDEGSPAYTSQLNYIRRIIFGLNIVSNNIFSVELAKTGLVPIECYIIVDYIKEFIDQDFKYLISINGEYDYSYEDIFERIYSVLPKHIRMDKEIFAFFSIPIIERDNPFFYGILAHEIGHCIFEKNNILEKLIFRPKEFEKLTKEFLLNDVTFLPFIKLISNGIIDKIIPNQLLDSIFKDFNEVKEEIKNMNLNEVSKEVIIRSKSTNVHNIIKSWIEEVFSDIFAIKLLGPAYFNSLIHFFFRCFANEEEFSLYIRERTPEHPPHLKRINYLKEQLNKMNYDVESNNGFGYKVFYDIWEGIKAFKPKSVPTIDHPLYKLQEIFDINNYSMLYPLCEKILDNLMPKIEIEVDKILKEKIFHFNIFSEKLEEMLFLLEKRIVICTDKDNRKTSLPIILNTAWEYYIQKHDKNIRKFIDEDNEIEVFLDLKLGLNNLIKKSIELFHIKEKYEKVRGFPNNG
ncbi:MAG: hypothetical protein ACTSVV_18540 [Promethearchaeota archaeon]